jgi:hypothetical protein
MSQHSRNWTLAAFAALSLLGIVGLAATALLGFEEPNSVLLLWSSALVLAAPAAILVHLIMTKDLTRQEKRIWLHEFASPRAGWAISEYLTSGDRRATAGSLAEQALARRRTAASSRSASRSRTSPPGTR